MSDWEPCPTALGTEISIPSTKTAPRIPRQKTNRETEGCWASPIEMTLNFGEQFLAGDSQHILRTIYRKEFLNTTIYAAALKTKPELGICKFCSCFAIKGCDQECNGLVHKAELILFLHLSYFWVPIPALFCGHSCRNYLPPGGQTPSGSSENPLCLFIWWIYFGATWLVALFILNWILFSKWSSVELAAPEIIPGAWLRQEHCSAGQEDCWGLRTLFEAELVFFFWSSGSALCFVSVSAAVTGTLLSQEDLLARKSCLVEHLAFWICRQIRLS